MYHIHCSGHIMPSELKRNIERIRPRKLFPIHTEHPELYGKYVADAARIESPVRGKTYGLNA
jgi:mRNA degradation ribonuclease J1/J2